MSELDQVPSPSEPKAQRKPRSRRRLVIGGLGGIVLLVLLAVATVPMWVNLPPVKRMALNIYNQGIEGRLDVERFELSWFNGQRLVGVTLYDPQGQQVAHMPVVETPDLNLIPIIRGTRNYGRVDVQVSQASLVQHDDGTLNAQRAMARPGASSGSGDSAGGGDPLEQLEQTKVRLNLQAQQVQYASLAADPVLVRDLSLLLDTRTAGTLQASTQGSVQQNDAAGRFAADVEVTNLRAGVAMDDAQVQAQAELADVPAQAASQVTQVAGLEALLGERLTARVQASGRLGDLQTRITAQSQHLDAQINLTRVGDLMHITDSHANLHVTPAAWEQVVMARVGQAADPQAQTAPQARLVEPFDIRMQIARLVLPSQDMAAHLAGIEADVLTELGDIVLQAADERIGMVALRQTRLTAQSQGMDQGVVVNLQAVPEQAGEQGEISLAVRLADLLDAQGQPVLGQASAQLDASLRDLPVALADQFMAMDGLLLDALGTTLHAHLAGRFSQDPQSETLAGTFEMQVQAQHLEAAAAGELRNQVLTLADTTQATLQVTPQLAARFLPAPDEDADEAAEPMRLAEPGQVQVRVTRLVVPMEAFDLSQVELGLTGQVQRLALAGDPRLQGVAIEQLGLTIAPARLDQQVNVELVGQVVQPAAPPGNMRVTAAFNGLLTDELTGQVQGELTNLPVAMLDAWQDVPGRLAATLGEQVQRLAFELDLTDRQNIPASLTFAAPNLQAELAGDLVMGQALTVRQAHAALTLTPQAMAAWQQANGETPPMRLLENADIRLVVEQAVVALTDPESDVQGPAYDLARTQLQARISSPRLRLRQAEQPPITMENLEVSIQSPALGQVVDLVADARFLMQVPGDAEPRVGRLESRNRLFNLIDSQGNIDWEQMAFEIDTQAQEIPVDAIDALLNLSSRLGIPGPMSAVLGDSVSLTLAATDSPQQAGELNVDLVAPFAQVHVPGRFVHQRSTEQNTAPVRRLHLREPATATLVVQPGLSEQVLSRINPIFITAMEATEPIQLRIDSDTFTAPLGDFDIAQVTADVSLQVGVLSLAHGGVLDLLLSLVNMSGDRITRASVSPMNMRLDGGVLQYNRFVIDGQTAQRDMVLMLNDLPIGFQGSVDLVNQQVNLETAFYPQTINRLLPRRARFDTDRALVIPMTGSLTSPQLDDRRFYEAIGRIAGQEVLREVLPEEARGIGGLLDVLVRPRQADNNNGNATRDTSPLAQRLPPGYQLPTPVESPEPAANDAEADQPESEPQPQEQPERRPDPVQRLRDLLGR